MKYFWGIYFGKLADFSASANIDPPLILLPYVDVLTHVNQASNGDVAVPHTDEVARW